MKLIVGLGNVGPKYETTRHNVGWLALDRMIDDWKATGPVTKHQGQVWSAEVRGQKVLLIKPQTFMNSSGKAVAPHFQFHKLTPSDVIVLHDELDLKPLSFRIKTGGGAGGHNGLRSLDACLGSDHTDYHRVRIGIGHPRALNMRIEPVDYVLGQFSDNELKGLDPLFDDIRDACEWLVAGDALGAMNRYNRKQQTE